MNKKDKEEEEEAEGRRRRIRRKRRRKRKRRRRRQDSTDVWEESIASIFRGEKQAKYELASSLQPDTWRHVPEDRDVVEQPKILEELEIEGKMYRGEGGGCFERNRN